MPSACQLVIRDPVGSPSWSYLSITLLLHKPSKRPVPSHAATTKQRGQHQHRVQTRSRRDAEFVREQGLFQSGSHTNLEFFLDGIGRRPDAMLMLPTLLLSMHAQISTANYNEGKVMAKQEPYKAGVWTKKYTRQCAATMSAGTKRRRRCVSGLEHAFVMLMGLKSAISHNLFRRVFPNSARRLINVDPVMHF
jgi:hypothetical protein